MCILFEIIYFSDSEACLQSEKTSSITAANGFNKYFTSIASNLNDSDYGLIIEKISNYKNYIKNSIQSSIYLNDCSSIEISEIIKELSTYKSSDIPIVLLKRCSQIISPILSNFYNLFMTMSSGTFPVILKTDIVSPVYIKELLF